VRPKLQKRSALKLVGRTIPGAKRHGIGKSNYPAAKCCQDNPANVVDREVGLIRPIMICYVYREFFLLTKETFSYT